MKAAVSRISWALAGVLASVVMLTCAFAPFGLGQDPAGSSASALHVQGQDMREAQGAAGEGMPARHDSLREAGEGSTQLASAGEGAVLRWENGARYRDGQVLVELAASLDADELQSRFSQLDFLDTADLDASGLAEGWALLRLAPGVGVADAVERMESSGLVESAQPNFVYHLLEGGAGQDALAAGSSVAVQSESPGWHLAMIGAYEAWEGAEALQAAQGLQKATVAIIDTGCDVAHVDLAANVVASYNTMDESSDVSDEVGHGTHIAGIIAAQAGNGEGVDGVSHDAGILPIKVMDDDETDTLNIIEAYNYVMKNAKRYNIRVVNMSLGAEQNGLDAADWALLRAIDKAHDAGILSVLAAGNDDEADTPYYCFPCDFSENSVGVVNVGSDIALLGLPDSSSNYNKAGEKTKDLAAPGVSIYSTMPGDSYGVMTGTSMSTPVVAGVAALAFSCNPDLSASQAKSLLCTTAMDIAVPLVRGRASRGFDDYTGYGLVRADRAVEGAAASYLDGPDGLAVGSRLQLSVPWEAALASSGTWTWTSDTPEVATVGATSGLVKGVGLGEAVISATNGGVTLRKTVVVYDISISGPSSVAIGGRDVVMAWANPVAAWTYESSKPSVASVGAASGIVKGKKAGTAVITAHLTACPDISVSKKVKVVKAANPMQIKVKSKSLSRSKLRTQAVKLGGCIKFVVKGKGTISYSKVKKGSSARLSVNSRTGKIKVAKNTRRGTYRIKVKVKAAGTAKYKAVSKTVSVKVRVK